MPTIQLVGFIVILGILIVTCSVVVYITVNASRSFSTFMAGLKEEQRIDVEIAKARERRALRSEKLVARLHEMIAAENQDDDRES